MKITPKDWREFQHYRTRRAPWVKLYHTLLDNRDFQCLPDASRALAPMLWLLASEQENGQIDASDENLTFRLRKSAEWIGEALKPLIDGGFFECDSEMLARRKQLATQETETETENKQLSSPSGRRSGSGQENPNPAEFDRFWDVWPAHHRKADRMKCAKVWVAQKLAFKADAIVVHVEGMKASEPWRKQGGEFIPAPLVYLNKKSWEAPIPGAVGVPPEHLAVLLDLRQRFGPQIELAHDSSGFWDPSTLRGFTFEGDRKVVM